MPEIKFSPRELCAQIWQAGVASVTGEQSVFRCLAELQIDKPGVVISIGKAAASMCLGALRQFPDMADSLVITKYGHVDARLRQMPACRIIESGHPVPDQNSLLAGKALLDTVCQMKPNSTLLFLVSGGASSLAEVLTPGVSLEDLSRLNKQMLSTSLSIDKINANRKNYSQIKAGQLLGKFKGKRIIVLGISDVFDDNFAVLGSGIGNFSTVMGQSKTTEYSNVVVGSNFIARKASVECAQELNLDIVDNEECLYGDLEIVCDRIFNRIVQGSNGVYIYGGEPTVELPTNPGRGGRNQSLSLMLAKRMAGRDDMTILVAGTDGTDGPTEAAGGMVDGLSFNVFPGGNAAILKADAGTFLEQTGDLFTTGPTGTNVMDLLVAVKYSKKQ